MLSGGGMAQSVAATESEMDKGLHPEHWYKEENHDNVPVDAKA